MLFRVFTVLAVLALCVSTWILSSPARHRQAQVDIKQADLPGYYLKNAVLTDYDIAGNPSIRIEAQRIEQIAHGSEAALYNIRVAYQTPTGQNWVMVGDTARVEPGGKVVDVSGNVRLQGDAAGREGAAIIHTDTLSYDVPDAVASTKSEVRIDFAQHSITARGLIANLKERTMRLESKVNGRFHP
ncbi:MAG: LPS export ABC transporter periplasmic protein LptC [Gammaproteobacteria bacterium]